MKECPNCGAINNEDALDCHACGESLGGDARGDQEGKHTVRGFGLDGFPSQPKTNRKRRPTPENNAGDTQGPFKFGSRHKSKGFPFDTPRKRPDRNSSKTVKRAGSRPATVDPPRKTRKDSNKATEGFPFAPSDKDGGDTLVAGVNSPGSRTHFGAPGRDGPKSDDKTSAPWMVREGQPPNNKTQGPWAARTEAAPPPPKGTESGLPFKPGSLKQPSGRPKQRKTFQGIFARSEDLGEGDGKPAHITEPRKKPGTVPSRQKTQAMGGVPAFLKDDDEPDQAFELRDNENVRSTLMGLPSLDAEDLAEPENTTTTNEIVAAGFQLKSPRHTAQMPALFAAQETPRKRSSDEAPDPLARTAPQPKLASSGARSPSATSTTPGSGLFRFPSRSSLKVKKGDSRKTLMGLPAIGEDEKKAKPARNKPTSAPGQYIFSKKKLSQSPEKIRINAALQNPGDSTPEKPSRGAAGSTMEMSIPVIGNPALKTREVPSKAKALSPSTTMRLSVPVIGDKQNKVKEDFGAAPGSEVESTEVAAKGLRPLRTPMSVRTGASSTMRINISEAMSQKEEEDLVHAATKEIEGFSPEDYRPSPALEAPQVDEDEELFFEDEGLFFDDEGDGDTAQMEGLEDYDFSLDPDPLPEDEEEAHEPLDVAATTPEVAVVPMPPMEPEPISPPPEPLKPTPTPIQPPPEATPAAKKPATRPSGLPSESLIRGSAILAGLVMCLFPILTVAGVGISNITAAPLIVQIALGFPLLGGLVALVAGAMKMPFALRSLIVGLVGGVLALLFMAAEFPVVSRFAPEILGRAVASLALLLPIGLVWRTRYTSGALSRVIVFLGMGLLVAAYMMPATGGTSIFAASLAQFGAGGNPLLGVVVLSPLVLLLPSLLAFRGSKHAGPGTVLALAMCLCLWVVPSATALLSSDLEVLSAVGVGAGLFACGLCVSVGFGDLLGWLTRPSDRAPASAG